MNNRFVEKSARFLLFFFAAFSILALFVICIYLIRAGLPAIFKIGIKEFFLNPVWRSTSENPQFGILSFMSASFIATFFAILIALPFSVMASVYLSKFANKRFLRPVETAIDILASIPSVVYGLLGIFLLVPAIRNIFKLPDGANLLCAILILAVMIIPTVVKLSLTSLNSVSKEYEEGAFALGLTEAEVYTLIDIRAAKSGIISAAILGIARAIGEAMAVIMVSGNAPNMPRIFGSVRFLTTAISSEMAYATGLAREALFSIGLVLFVFTIFLNLILFVFFRKDHE